MSRPFIAITTACFMSAYAGTVLAQDEIRTERVQFAKGTSGASIRDSVTGYDAVDYLLGAGEGQVMTVEMASDNLANYFNLIAPGETDVAFFIGSTQGNTFTGALPAKGDYRIRVYLMRSAARRGETANFTLDVSITSAQAAAPQQDALVPGTGFNATGMLACARGAGQPMGQCEFGVTREGDGNGMITVFWPDGGSRVIFFETGTPAYFDQSEADGDAEMTVGRNADLFSVTIGDERFEFPEAVITGD